MSRWLQRLSLGLALLLLLAGIAQSQQQGGAFLPAFSYLISGQWTWRGQASPFVFEGTTDNTFETTFTVTNPTADRTVTLPNATGTVMLAAGASTSAVASGITTLDGSNPTSVTTGLSVLAGCTVTRHESSAPALDPLIFSVLTTATAGRLDVYAWKATASGDGTMVASTNNTSRLQYVCVGTS